jgi:hypothetical protein
MLLETLFAFAAVALLGLVLKVFFGNGRDAIPLAWPSGGPDDFGLLTPAASVDDPATAEDFRHRLAEAGIRATTTRAQDGRYHVLVFPAELDRARDVVGNT